MIYTRLGIIAVWIIAFSLIGCGRSEDNTLRFGMRSNPITLDPRFATDAASTRINRLLYRRLVDFDDAYQPIPELADWELLAPTHYRFRLQQHIRFHDGTALTAEDVKATYDFVLHADNGSPHRGSLTKIKDIQIINSHTIDFILDEPDPLFPGRLVIGILPAKRIASGHPFNTEPIGSGAFEFRRWSGEGTLRLRRRRDSQPVEFVQVPNPTMRVLKLIRGEIDMLQGDLPSELVNWLSTREAIRVTTRSGSNFAYVGFNLDDPITGDRRLRQAIAHAIDKQAIIKHLLGQFAHPANALLPPEHWAGNRQLAAIEYDPQRSRELLAESGYSLSNPVRITYKTSSDPQRIRIATLILDQLAKVGIAVDLRTYDWGTFYGDIKAGRFQMYSLSWIGIKMPDIFRYTMHSTAAPPNGANRGRFSNPRADDLIERAEAATTLTEQAGYYRELQTLLLRQLPYVPLWYEDQVFIAAADIHGFRVAGDGNYDGLQSVVQR